MAPANNNSRDRLRICTPGSFMTTYLPQNSIIRSSRRHGRGELALLEIESAFAAAWERRGATQSHHLTANEFPPLHSITSSACASSACGTVSLSAFTALSLLAIS